MPPCIAPNRLPGNHCFDTNVSQLDSRWVSLQVEADAPLTLQLGLSAAPAFRTGPVLILLALVAALAGLLLRQPERVTRI